MPKPVMYDNEKWIYDAICHIKNPGPIFEFSPNEEIYIYKNTLYPNKKYSKTFNPKSFMKRGDVINFGETYMNNNKMIFNGNVLLFLYTYLDDNGSVPPQFVCGDKDDEFNIGDFEGLIDHNTINFLSYSKKNAIEYYVENDIIKGKVSIKGKEWKIDFLNYYDKSVFEIYLYSMKIDKNNKFTFGYRDYLIKSENDLFDYQDTIQTFIVNGVKTHLCKRTKEYDLTDESQVNFPFKIKKMMLGSDINEIIFNADAYEKYLESEKNLKEKYNPFKDVKYIITEFTMTTVTIECIKIDYDSIINNIKQKLESSSVAFHRINDELLEVH
jgi:hypothetical protein